MSERSAQAPKRRRRRFNPEHDAMPWPEHLSLGDKLQRLALLAPLKLRAFEILLNETLADVWPRV